MRASFVETLFQKATVDPNIVLLTADLGFGLFERFEQSLPAQFINVGIAEQNMMGLAAGMASEGKTVVAYSLGNFPTLRCIEQIRNDVAYHEGDVKIVASGGGFSYGQLGMSHHATEDLSIMRALPNIDVLAPCSAYEAACLTNEMLGNGRPSYLRLDKSCLVEAVMDNAPSIGRIRLIEDFQCKASSHQVLLLGIGGSSVSELSIVSQSLVALGVNHRVASCHTLSPLDVDGLAELASTSTLIVTLEENVLSGGLFGALSEVLVSQVKNTVKTIPFGLADRYTSEVGDQDFLKKVAGIDHVSIFNSIVRELAL